MFQTKEGGLELFLSEVSELVDTTAVGRSSGVVKFNTFNIGFENVESFQLLVQTRIVLLILLLKLGKPVEQGLLSQG